MPASRASLGPFYQDVIAVDPLEPWGAASAAYRLETLARTLPFPVDGARLVLSNNNDVWRLPSGYLRVARRPESPRQGSRPAGPPAGGIIPVPEVLDLGGDERLSWSLTTAMPGTPLDELCTWPAPPGLRDLARQAAGLLRALHSWPVPAGLARTLRGPVADPDPLCRAGAELVLLPPAAALVLIR